MATLAPPIPPNACKEWISVALVEGFCAQAQLNVTDVRWDDGIDLQVGSTKPLVRGKDPGPIFISLQLKCTSSPTYSSGTLHFPLKRKTYERLRNPNAVHDQYLVVYVVPKPRKNWILPDKGFSRFHEVAYYLNLRGLPALTKKKSSQTVAIPLANRLTADVLYNAVRTEFSKW